MQVVAKVVFDRLPQLRGLVRSNAIAAVEKTSSRIEERMKQSMTGSKSGKVYRRRGGKTHQASAPGEPPAVDYGALIGSIQDRAITPLTHEVGSFGQEHAAYTELGTRHMAARPWARPAAEAEFPDFVNEMKRILP